MKKGGGEEGASLTSFFRISGTFKYSGDGRALHFQARRYSFITQTSVMLKQVSA